MSYIGPKSSIAGGLGGISIKSDGFAIGPKSSVAGGLGGISELNSENNVASNDKPSDLLKGIDLKKIKLEWNKLSF